MILAYFKYIESWIFFLKFGLLSVIENLKKQMIYALNNNRNNNNNIAFVFGYRLCI